MMTGEYRVYIDGELASISPNIITNFGKASIIRYLAGNISSFAGAIAAGVDQTRPSPTNFDMNYELFRVPIIFKSASFSDSQVVFKATAPVGLAGTVWEIGLFPSVDNVVSGSYQTRTLFEFDADESWQNVALRESINSRVGTSAIAMTGNSLQTIYNSNVNIDLSGYSATDVFKLAVIRFDQFCTSIDIRFTTSDGADIFGSFPMPVYPGGVDYEIISIQKSAFSNQNANWRSIVRAEVTANFSGGTGKIALDGLKMVDADNLNPEFGLVSHTVLSSPVIKTTNNTMDIEYRLAVPL